MSATATAKLLNKVVSGKDGKLFVTVGDGDPVLLFEAENFQATLNYTNTDIQALGSILVGALTTGVSVGITLSEFVVRDDVTVIPVIEALNKNKVVNYTFQGSLDRSDIDGQESRQVFRDCVPDGSHTLMGLAPGEVVKRDCSYRGNALPEILKYFEGE